MARARMPVLLVAGELDSDKMTLPRRLLPLADTEGLAPVGVDGPLLQYAQPDALYAEGFPSYRDYASVVELQVVFADLVVFHKADLVTSAALARAEVAVRQLNDRAVSLPAVCGWVDPALLFGALPTGYRDDPPSFVAARRAEAEARHPDWARPPQPPPAPAFPERAFAAGRDLPVHAVEAANGRAHDALDHDDHHGHDHDHADPLHGYHLGRDGIATVEWASERPVGLAALKPALKALAGLGVYRAKGIVTLAETPPRRCVVNVVAGRYELEPRSPADGPSQLVCIGKGAATDRAAILAGWEACAGASTAATSDA